jgi:predicted N-formylglutamate amidohydrolase
MSAVDSKAGSAVLVEDAYELRQGPSGKSLLLGCEHASERLPPPFTWPVPDLRLVGTHWAYDLGARELTLELACALDVSCVLSRFTRLLVDPNREESHSDLFRAVAEGEPVLLNRAVSSSERALRIARFYRPYHDVLDAELARVKPKRLLSLHSFTPVYEGKVREVELGVLFDREEQEAARFGDALARELPGVAYNEPWSGKAGLIYSAASHAEKHGAIALELEVRQDLAVNPEYRARLVSVLARYFSAL